MILFTKKQTCKVIIISLSIIYSLLVTILFFKYCSEIYYSVKYIEGMWSVVIFILIRIIITFGMSIYAFYQLIKENELKVSNFAFLFVLFFLGLTYGKTIDLLYKLIYFSTDESSALLILKIRYIMIILTMAPLILQGFNLLIGKSTQDNEIAKMYPKKLLVIVLITIIIGFESLLVIIAPNIFYISIILICIHIPSLIWIIITFFYSYKKKENIQKGYLIISIAFVLDLTLYVLAIISTPSRRRIIGFSPVYLIIAEIIDLIIITMIFLGFYKEINSKIELDNFSSSSS